MNNVSAILCSDLHLRDTVPACRKDTYFKEQMSKLWFIRNLQAQHDCPVLCAGDVFDHWKASPWLMTMVLRNMPKDFCAIPGQHDMPNHNYNLMDKSGFRLLEEAGKLHELTEGIGEIFFPQFTIDAYRWGSDLPPRSRRGSRAFGSNVAICHSLTWEDTSPFPGASGNNAQGMLARFPNACLVLTGDNHKQFVYRSPSGQLLVNPGSMMRMSSDQAGHRPAVYLWREKDNTLERVELPFKEDSLLMEDGVARKEREDEIFSFVQGLQETKDISLNFVDNLKKYISQNKIEKNIEQRIWEVCDDDG